MTVKPNPEKIALAQELCKYLTEYEVEPDRCLGVCSMIKHKSGDGRQISIRTEGHSSQEKYIVRPTWPRYDGSVYAPDESCRIGVSVKRGIETLAKEIKRRFIPSYHEQYPIQLAKKQEWVDRDNKTKSLRDHIVCDLLNDTIGAHEQRSEQISCCRYGVRQVGVSGERVRLVTDYLPEDVAIEIVTLLKKRMPENR